MSLDKFLGSKFEYDKDYSNEVVLVLQNIGYDLMIEIYDAVCIPVGHGHKIECPHLFDKDNEWMKGMKPVGHLTGTFAALHARGYDIYICPECGRPIGLMTMIS